MATDYLAIIKSEQFDEIKKIFDDNKPSFLAESEKARNEYDVMSHSVMINDINNRPDKTVWNPKIDENTGQPLKKSGTNELIIERGTSKVNRVPVPFQEIIVERRVAFMLGNPIKYDATYDDGNPKEKAVVDYVYEIEDNAKTLYKNKELARRVMSELACAELWYLVPIVEKGFWNRLAVKIGVKTPNLQVKMTVFSPWLNDDLYPLFDDFGDMVAFARGYKLKEDNKEIEHFDIYTAELTYKWIKNGDGWVIDPNFESVKLDGSRIKGGKIPNPVKKIPVIYHTQLKPEWAKVQPMISRIEKLLSNHGDMNDYFGEPILAVFGQIIQAIKKGDSGKIMQLAQDAKASFLALDSPPESIKMEIENLEKFIFALSQTPNIAFSEMKSLGDLSGVALELMFLDAHLAVKAKEETFGIGIQRRVNLLKAFIGNVLDISLAEATQAVKMKPVFTPYMPKNIKELVEMVDQAVSGGVLSTVTATEILEDEGFIPDAAQEQDRLKEEADEKAKRNNLIGMNV